ncbi:hypothetical protein GSI_14378 [Ganoderma sinense ZZ0214-1]|uniref:Uncharacterized protein n=1 Tax=Ganoderma sinense ZZ0214-1 TaxID=1077348 RepID=A0A2G8RNJ3_9APHY|nr:hypothetical protein GSI_14378 [Ganoderma sinense ZZ0214-1]
MPPLPRWLDKARATSARLISNESDPQDPSTPRPPTTSRSILARARSGRRPTREVDNYADIPPFLLPLSVRVQLDRERAKHKARSRAAPYDKTLPQTQAKNAPSQNPNPNHPPQKPKPKPKQNSRRPCPTLPALTMPALLKRLAGPRTCPIVVAQYKDEYRGVGHEEELHWALVVITDRATLSGPSFQAYAQRRRRRSRSSKSKPRPAHSMSAAAQRTTLHDAANTNTNTNTNTRTLFDGNGNGNGHGEETRTREPQDADGEYDTQWYARHAPASLYDVCATVRTLCLGGVQVGAVRAADVGKLTEYLQSHPPAPTHAGWSSRDYVLELLELLRPFKMLREDLQSLPVRKRGDTRGRETWGRTGMGMGMGTGTVEVADLLPELREVGRVTQESIFNEEFRPFVKYHP